MSKKIVYRSSITGHFITKGNAQQHPNTSEKQQVQSGKK